MKKKVLIFALMLTSISYSFAGPNDGISKRAVAAFTKDFSDAKDIKWERKDIFTKATFILDAAVMSAYYSTDGELVAVARSIFPDQLPIAQLLSLKKAYKDYSITELLEVNYSKDNDKAYYVLIENQYAKVVLESIDDGGWGIYSKNGKR